MAPLYGPETILQDMEYSIHGTYIQQDVRGRAWRTSFNRRKLEIRNVYASDASLFVETSQTRAACPSRHAKEVESIFPGLCADGVLVIPTCQKTTMDLARVGEQVEQEKDACLERFMRWSKLVCESLERKGCWSDYVDPCSGLPMIHRQQAHRVYGEVDALSTLLGYDTINSGCCKIVLHPRWGSCVYPATLFARCDVQTLQESIREATDAM